MKYCQNCGNTASDNTEYCSVCGTAFDDPRPGGAVSRETVYVYESVPEPESAPVPEERVTPPVTVVIKTEAPKTAKPKKHPSKNSKIEEEKTERLNLLCETFLALVSLGVLVFLLIFIQSSEIFNKTEATSSITQTAEESNSTWNRVKDTASEAWDETKNAAGKAWNDMKDAWNSAMDD